MSELLAQQCGADTPRLNWRIGITVTNLFVKSTVKEGLIRKSSPTCRNASTCSLPVREVFADNIRVGKTLMAIASLLASWLLNVIFYFYLLKALQCDS